MSRKQKVRVYQIRRDKSIRKFLIEEKKIELTDFSYIIIDNKPLILRPEFILLSREGKEFLPTLLVDDKYEILNPNPSGITVGLCKLRISIRGYQVVHLHLQVHLNA